MQDTMFLKQQIIGSLEWLPFDSLKFLFELIQILRFRNKPPVETKMSVEPSQDVWHFLAEETGTIQAPVDWAINHDHYLYGTPKQTEVLNE